MLVDPVGTSTAPGYPSAFAAEAQALGVRLQGVDAGAPEAIDAALATIPTSGADALLIQDSDMFSVHRQRILEYATNPANYPSSAFQLQETQVAAQALGVQLQVVEIRSPDEFENAFAAMTEAGCLIAYAPDILAMFRRAAVFVDKILKGTTPVDLPVELPHKLELFLNAKTAEVLGLTFPPTLLRLADEVIK